MREVLNGRYGVDQAGTIYSLRNTVGHRRAVPQPMKLRPTRDGYLTLNVYEDTDTGGVVKRTYFAHRMVALAYHPNPDNKPEVNHKDGVKWHNWPNNLEWSTPTENAHHAFDTGLRTAQRPYLGKFNDEHNRSRPIKQLTLEGKLVQVYPSAHEAKRQGFSQANISSVIAGRRKSHKGFRWAFA